MKSGCAKNERAREETVDKNYIEMGFAKIDSGRKERTGFAETIFCQGKADQYLVDIFERIYEENGEVLGTRATVEQYELVRQVVESEANHLEND